MTLSDAIKTIINLGLFVFFIVISINFTTQTTRLITEVQNRKDYIEEPYVQYKLRGKSPRLSTEETVIVEAEFKDFSIEHYLDSPRLKVEYPARTFVIVFKAPKDMNISFVPQLTHSSLGLTATSGIFIPEKGQKNPSVSERYIISLTKDTPTEVKFFNLNDRTLAQVKADTNARISYTFKYEGTSTNNSNLIFNIKVGARSESVAYAEAETKNRIGFLATDIPQKK